MVVHLLALSQNDSALFTGAGKGVYGLGLAVRTLPQGFRFARIGVTTTGQAALVVVGRLCFCGGSKKVVELRLSHGLLPF
jgi:hypothetical protein